MIIKGVSPLPTGLIPYQHYIRFLYSKYISQLSPQEMFEEPYRDFLQSPLQPLAHHLQSSTYETFEKDPVKYAQYCTAIKQALLDRCREDQRFVIMVVGAGRGPLVSAALKAAKEAKR